MKHQILVAAIAAAAAGTVQAQLFTADFDTDQTANWTVNASAGTHPANVFFDYSTVGIPSAPNSVGGTTLGLKLQANTTGGVFGGVSVSPTGQSFSGDFELTFDMWLNYNGPLGPTSVGGNGSTQVTGAGILTAGTTPQWAGGAQDSVHFGATGDGGSSVDFRAYSPAAGTGYVSADGVFAAGAHSTSRNGSDAYYAGFGGASAPGAQVGLFAQQTGTTQAGSPGFAWREVSIRYENNIATYTIDGLLIATVDVSTAGTTGGGNILFNHYDINATSSTDPNAGSLLFGLVDNVVVTAVPEPEEYAAIFGGVLVAGALLRRRFQKR